MSESEREKDEKSIDNKERIAAIPTPLLMFTHFGILDPYDSACHGAFGAGSRFQMGGLPPSGDEGVHKPKKKKRKTHR